MEVWIIQTETGRVYVEESENKAASLLYLLCKNDIKAKAWDMCSLAVLKQPRR